MKDKDKVQISPKISQGARDLLKIVHGDTQNLKVPHKSIITGKKLKNSILRQFTEKFLQQKTINPEQLIEVILILDEMIEQEHLTEEALEAIRKDPSILNNIIE